MAFEIGRVPPGWEHPKEDGKFVPLLGKPHHEALVEWKEARDRYDKKHGRGAYERNGETAPEQCNLEFPKRGAFVPFTRGQASAFQVYEDTTEGTPVSPVFATKEAIAPWLVAERGLTAEVAAAFVEVESVPSAIELENGKKLYGFACAPVLLEARRLHAQSFAGQNGLSPSPRIRGRFVFLCVCPGCKGDGPRTEHDDRCGRTQHYASRMQTGGLTVEEATTLGWRRTEAGWACPFCSGNTEALRKVFDRAKAD